MFDVKRLVQVTLYVLAMVSGALLGLGLESQRLIAIAIVGATIGFVVTDWYKLFRIEGALANFASVIILFLAMNGFFSEDSTGKLVSVANLLVYLQTVLMFQEKTPRLNWQILVLSLLQVVVGTIFSLDFEAGLLFLFYFFVAGLAMVLQSVYTEAVDIERRNRKLTTRLMRETNSRKTNGPGKTESSETGEGRLPSGAAALMFYDPGEPNRFAISALVWQLVIWISVSTAFASVMFYLVPRHSKPWFGPGNIEVTSAGVSKSVDLDERGLITLSGQLMFRVSFNWVDTGEPVDISGDPPYFRGLALSSLVIEDGKTNWIAPHDRIAREYYQDLMHYAAKGVPVHQTITLEETTDPLIYGIMPFFRTNETPQELAFCHEISALTRCRTRDRIALSPYKYEGGTVVDENGGFCKAWPYISNKVVFEQKPMSHDPPQQKWLTQMDPSRYPALVGLSEQLAEEHRAAQGNRIDLFRKLEGYFLEPGRFRYTLDFRSVKRNDRIDPIEDFVRNHRSGHCELFASALTLMLRNQDIPSRLVVGFHGAEHNSLNGSYKVRAKNAHAWVEAYLRPEDCPQSMMDNGQAGPGGAWMILDPTPISFGNEAGSVGEGAIDLARTVWDDYVLGMDSDPGSYQTTLVMPLFGFMRNLNVDALEAEFRNRTRFTRNPLFKYIFAGFSALLMLLIWLRVSNRLRQPNRRTASLKVGRLRRLVAGAISLIAPGLGSWVMERAGSASPTAFYQRMHDLLETCGLSRRNNQTHREFANEVTRHFAEHPSASLIQSTVCEVTELFNEVRFGNVELEDDLSDQIDLSLVELKVAIQAPLVGEPG